MQQIILEHKRALGDSIVLSALVRDLALTYPGRFQVDVRTNFGLIWRHHKHITKLVGGAPGVNHIALDYEYTLRASHSKTFTKHFIAAFHAEFERRMQIKVPLLYPKPDLHLSEEERTVPLVSGKYWVVFGGGKTDMTIKHWQYDRYQEVVNRLREKGLRFVQAGSSSARNIHPPMQNVLNLIGHTNERDLLRLIWHSEGAIGPLTSAAHICAWAEKPYVAIAGGREEVWWAHYGKGTTYFGNDLRADTKIPQRILHTIGKLDCCRSTGCDKQKVVRVSPKDRGVCLLPVLASNQQHVAMCMDMVTTDQVVDAVWSYYEDGTLQNPLQGPTVSVLSGFGFETSEPVKPPQFAQIEEPKVIGKMDQPVPIPPMPKGVPATFKAPTQVPVAPELVAQKNRTSNYKAGDPLWDHPIIGGKLSIFVCCYGNYPMLARDCINGILSTVPPDRLSLRIGANTVSEETMSYLQKVPDAKLYIETDEAKAKKYVMMRRMFWDPLNPITTNYVVWFDDDTRIIQNSWVQQLLSKIVNDHPRGCRAYGDILRHDVKSYRGSGGVIRDGREWFTKAPWYKKRSFRNTRRQAAPNGNSIFFPTGWFWALATETIRAGDIPCPRLYHNGGDITIGEQIYQAGGELSEFNKNKQLVFTAKGNRRGFSETFPWERA